MNIKTWSQRITPESTVVAQLRAMQAEINELRAENAAQRKVLEQALEALQYCVQEAGPCEHECGVCVCKEASAITAIQGVLK